MKLFPLFLGLLSPVLLLAASNDSRLADAVQNQDQALVARLLKQHVDVNGIQPDRTTALIWAAHWKDTQLIDTLLAAGADAKAVNRYGTSAITEAVDQD